MTRSAEPPPSARDELIVRPASSFGGTLAVPGDKSISHRALIVAGLAPVPVELRGLADGGAVRHTRRAMAALGAWFEERPGGVLRVEGVGAPGIAEPGGVVDCGGSATTMRLLAGLAATGPGITVLAGDASLRRRPMDRVVDPLRAMGATVLAARRGTRAPVVVRGGELRGIDHRLPVASAQVVGCLLLAGLGARGEVIARLPAPARDHTERMLRHWGVAVDTEGGPGAWGAEGGAVVRMAGGQPLVPPSARPVLGVPGDLSTAAFALVAAAAVPGAEITVPEVGINPSRGGVLEVLEEMGAEVVVVPRETRWGEPVGDVTLRAPERLRAFDLGGRRLVRALDEVPALAVAASVAEGTSRVADAAELRVKESDRLAALGEQLGRLGVELEEEAAGLLIRGGTLRGGGAVESRGDHRVAAALVVAGLLADAPVAVRGVSCASAAWPTMIDDLDRLRGPGRTE